MPRDRASAQLSEFKVSQRSPDTLTTSDGAPIANKLASQTVGPRGPLLMQVRPFILAGIYEKS